MCGILKNLESDKKTEISVNEIIQIYRHLWIPHFQRGYVWGDDSVSLLLESLFYSTPCGSIIIWKSDEKDIGEPLVFQDGCEKDSQKPKYFIIDGQQRIRSLYQVFKKTSEGGEQENDDEQNGDSQSKEWCINLTEYPPLKGKLSPLPKRYRLFIRTAVPTKQDNTQKSKIGPFQKNVIPLRIFGLFENHNNLDDIKFEAELKKYNIILAENAKEEEVIKKIREEVRKQIIAIKEQKLFIKVYSNKGKSYDEIVKLYNRVNSAGKRVEAEEKAFATLVSLFPKTNEKIKGIFEVVHGENAHQQDEEISREYLKRQKERNFGFKQFIRTFIQVCNYHFGYKQTGTAYAFPVVENPKFQEMLLDNNKAEDLWKKTDKITGFLVSKQDGLLRKELFCDDLRFLPETRSLWPILQLLIQWPDLMDYDCRNIIAYYTLCLQLVGKSEEEIIKLISTINEISDLSDAIDKLDKFLTENNKNNAQDKQNWFKEYLETELKNKESMSLLDRNILLLYWILRKQKARDFSYDANVASKNKTKFKDAELEINEGCEPEKQHIIPFSELKKIYGGDIKRTGTNEANNIGNITYISRKLNSFEEGIGEDPLKLEEEDKTNLSAHFLDGEITDKYQELINEKDINKLEEFYKVFCNERREAIINKWNEWLCELKERANEEREKLEDKKPELKDRIVVEEFLKSKDGLKKIYEYFKKKKGIILPMYPSKNGLNFKISKNGRIIEVIQVNNNEIECIFHWKFDELCQASNCIKIKSRKKDSVKILVASSQECVEELFNIFNKWIDEQKSEKI